DKARISQKALINDEMRLIVRADHKWAGRQAVDLGELHPEPFIIREQGSGTLKSLGKNLEEAGTGLEALTVTAELGSTAAVIQGIKSGIGISVLSPIAVSEQLQSGALKALPIRGLDLQRNFYLTTHADRTPSPACKAFMDYLENTLSDGAYNS
ncbi:MAG: LysR family transcriptional regulator, partial [Desulfobacteraceae bacterium]|nr:LysR family transcriptional regulator [Desulfobacteraceae bacterium]